MRSYYANTTISWNRQQKPYCNITQCYNICGHKGQVGACAPVQQQMEKLKEYDSAVDVPVSSQPSF
jgi:1-aminocyclopropane-1-carboxylate deaminase/D-cysteine desulfhydrase-like pyridoxal-dependent ACC family enzyme